jgi:hypothetical protein
MKILKHVWYPFSSCLQLGSVDSGLEMMFGSCLRKIGIRQLIVKEQQEHTGSNSPNLAKSKNIQLSKRIENSSANKESILSYCRFLNGPAVNAVLRNLVRRLASSRERRNCNLLLSFTASNETLKNRKLQNASIIRKSGVSKCGYSTEIFGSSASDPRFATAENESLWFSSVQQ